MNQIERIENMENILGRAEEVVSELKEALSEFETILPELDGLFGYYENGGWQEDYDADARGEIPVSLKRGVLSQDAVYDLISDYTEVIGQMSAILKNRDKKSGE